MQNLTVLKHRAGPVRGRHPWVFSGALKAIPEGLKGGQEVRLVDEQANFLAYGYFNSYSQIAVRLWSWDEKEEINGTEYGIKRRIELADSLVVHFYDGEISPLYINFIL
jgi:23S rRNA (cytosine1962-C5)-methyltransferase